MRNDVQWLVAHMFNNPVHEVLFMENFKDKYPVHRFHGRTLTTKILPSKNLAYSIIKLIHNWIQFHNLPCFRFCIHFQNLQC